MTRRGIVLLRHAKAEQPDQMADTERGLTPRGHSDAAHAGRWLASQELWPELVVCSPARRTRQTWHEVSAAGPQVPTRFEPLLYGGTARDLMTLVRSLDADVSRVLVVGHNPTISYFSALLDPAGASDSGLRTCGIAVHEFTGDWSGCGPEAAPSTNAYTARGANAG
ncbi:SixA phosphatase family protein [Micromonospora sp. NBC_01813]|uniref:SixA phosphatase family protein n=1 Tax=Micromonospora sp. NBC_01813 TaxID=2975988 RepID=UPI002DDB72CD|nr:histidine phosphatase family protein [Micromonospora sp. NBC_01813]WSA07432.1 histidine phosphatase family protein [Micromonospora sp. NBC_01813]